MKILRIIARLNVGGPARHVVWLTSGLSGGEFESVLIAGTVPPGEENMAYLAEANGIRPIFIEEMSRELSPKDLISLIKIYREIRREKPDIIHTHTAKAGTVGRTAAFFYKWFTPGTIIGRPRKVRVVHTFHGHVFHSYYGKLKTSVFLMIERALARFATDRIIVISDRQFSEINGKYRIGRNKQFAVIPLGIDLSPFSAASRRKEFRAEFGAEPNEVLVGFVGRLTEIKNIPLLLAAAEIYQKGKPEQTPKLKFVIIGDGHLRSELERESEERGIQEIVHFAGNRTDTESLYSALDIVALTSRNEGTPLSLIEAMAAERPFVSTTVGGVGDLLGETKEHFDGFAVYERGIGVKPGSAEAFLLGLLYLANNERLQNALAVHSKTFVETKYSKKRLVNDIEEFYRSL